MPGYAPLFGEAATNVPVNTTPLTSRRVKDALRNTVIGAAPGVSTVVNKSQTKHAGSAAKDNFGSAAVESATEINRVSTAGDVTAMKSAFIQKNPSFTFPRDLSGNGGPAFTRS